MDKQEIFSKLEKISVFKYADGVRAPYKPLLFLYALGQLQLGVTDIRFVEAELKLKELFSIYGPETRGGGKPLYPFWYLKNDGLWRLKNVGKLINHKGKSEPLLSEMRNNDVVGSFEAEFIKVFQNDQMFANEVVNFVLKSHFPDSLHGDILSSVGISIEGEKKRRDPAFREKVLIAYRYKCAVCGLNVQLNGKGVGLEAAHIKWHQAGGPDTESNGFALCSLHHTFFDRGVYTVDEQSRILLSKKAHGGGLEKAIGQYHGGLIATPKDPSDKPEREFLEWHKRQVFRSPSLYLNLESSDGTA